MSISRAELVEYYTNEISLYDENGRKDNQDDGINIVRLESLLDDIIQETDDIKDMEEMEEIVKDPVSELQGKELIERIKKMVDLVNSRLEKEPDEEEQKRIDAYDLKRKLFGVSKNL